MKPSTLLRAATFGAGAALYALCGVALAAHDSGDSSMNPFTGDSYAYFHGGHNLGEGAMIRPGGTPPPTGWQLYPPSGHAASAPSRKESPPTAARPAQPTARFAPDDTSARVDARH